MYPSAQYGTDISFIFHRGEAEKLRLIRTWKEGCMEMTSGSKAIHLSTHITSRLNHK